MISFPIKSVVRRVVLILLLIVVHEPPLPVHSSLSITTKQGLMYDIKEISYSKIKMDMEIFDGILGIQLGGFRGESNSTSVQNGTKQLSAIIRNGTKKINVVDSLTTHLVSETKGEEYKVSLFNSGWKNVDKFENRTTFNETAHTWPAVANIGEWQNITDFVAATLHNYQVFNLTTRGSGPSFSLSGINATADYRKLHWNISSHIIPNIFSIDGIELGTELVKYRYQNNTNHIYKDVTDDLFNNVPYNITQYLTMDFLYDPLSTLFLQVNYTSFFHLNFHTRGSFEDGSSLIQADMVFDINVWRIGSQQLSEVVELPYDDGIPPNIIEQWEGSIPDRPKWKLNDTGVFAVYLSLDSSLVDESEFVNHGEVSLDLKRVIWENVTLVAIDNYQNKDMRIYYYEPGTSPWWFSITIIPVFSLIYLLKKRRFSG